MYQGRGDSPAWCRVRPGEECRLCVPGATGPDDCGLAYLVATDPELPDMLARLRRPPWAADPGSVPR
jgi:Domain of unknown function (DUF6767)